MDVTTHSQPATAVRRPGPDVVRAVALIGVVVMNYHGYLVLRGGDLGTGWAADLFDPWTGPLATRFAATFVLVAGVGVTLLTRSSVGDPERTSAMRWRLASRGLLLYGVGLAYDQVWPGSILPFYGAMFLLAAWMFTLRSRWLVVIGLAAAVAAWAIRAWRLERELDGGDVSWLTSPGPGSPRGLVLDVMVNGTHPLLPWLAFFCAGIVVGRVLDTAWWRPAAIASGFTLYALGTIAGSAAGTGERAAVLASVDPFERGGFYVLSALGTALVAFGVLTWIADRYEHTWPVDVLRRAGQLTLTLYLLHGLVFNLVVDWLGWLRPTGLDTALLAATAFWAVGLAAAAWWHHRFGRGPAEHLYRGLTA